MSCVQGITLASVMVKARDITNLILWKREIKPSEDRVRLPTWWGNWKWSHTQSSRPMQCTCTRECMGVGAHTR